ncbi:MAG: DUF4097 family beta strand repeat-containing protein [Clostridium sp.]|uniref:DUF4097 family beta strand repeat-containing protein n=1 Tax=Clostridium sp. TaxID=1506 RepID=UPI0030366626
MGRRKNIVTIAASLIVVGGIMTTVGFLTGGNRDVMLGKDGFKVYDDGDYIKENKDLEKFTAIDIDMDFGDIEIIKSDKYAIELEFDKEVMKLNYSVNNEKLTISSENKEGNKFINLNFGSINNKSKVKIYVPEDIVLSSLDIESNSGSIAINNIDINASNINCDFGDISLDGINGNKLNINSKSGTVKIKNMKLDELTLFVDFGDIDTENIYATNLKLNSKSGEVNTKLLTSNTIEINSDFGDIDASGLVSNGLLINAKSGTVNLAGALKGSNVINCDFGDIDIETNLAKNQYSYSVDMDFGSSKIDGIKADGDTEVTNDSAENNFDINCKSGDLKIQFSK